VRLDVPRKGGSGFGSGGFLGLGGVFLCVTGAEALYADMGHFGAGEPAVIISRALAHPAFVPLAVDEVD
jgi:K+ transporter